jgi:hypothetical protein
VAVAKPEHSTRIRNLAFCRRVTAACSSRNAKAASTASTWAIVITATTSASPNAHRSDTDLGALKVASMARTLVRFPPANTVPLAGWRRSISARRSSPATTPFRPSLAASLPDHTPGDSPWPR